MFDLVVGAGQGGCRMAKSFADVYNAEGRYINLANVDFGKLDVPKAHTLVIGGEGTGRDPDIGELMAQEHFEDIRVFLDDAIAVTETSVVALCIGGGGGSGTGTMFLLIDYFIKEKGIEVFLVFTLPQKGEGIPAKPNALRALNRLIRNYIGKGIAKNQQVVPMLVDNDFCLSKYGVSKEGGYWYRVNRGIAKALRRFYDLTDTEKMSRVDVASGFGALDHAEFQRILFFKEGFLDIREVTFTTYDVEDKSEIRKKVKTASLIFGSLDIRTTKAYIVSVALPAEWKMGGRGDTFTSALFDLIGRSTKTPYVLRSSFYSSRIKNARVCMLLAGMAKSHGLDKILRQTIKDADKYRNKTDVEEMDLDGIDF